MAKQAKMKKGSIGKKALAAILAASMVLSSSAFSVLASVSVPGDGDGDVTVPDAEVAPASLNEENGIAVADLPAGHKILLGFRDPVTNEILSGWSENIVYNNTKWEPEVVVVDCVDPTHHNIKQCYDATTGGWNTGSGCRLVDLKKDYYKVYWYNNINAAVGLTGTDGNTPIQDHGVDAEAKFAAAGPYACVNFSDNQQEGDTYNNPYKGLGSYFISFKIKPIDLDDVDVAIPNLQYDHTYNGKKIYPGMYGFQLQLGGEMLNLTEPDDFIARPLAPCTDLISASDLEDGNSDRPIEDKWVQLVGINSANEDLDGDGKPEKGNYSGILGNQHYDGNARPGDRNTEGYESGNDYPSDTSKKNDRYQNYHINQKVNDNDIKIDENIVIYRKVGDSKSVTRKAFIDMLNGKVNSATGLAGEGAKVIDSLRAENDTERYMTCYEDVTGTDADKAKRLEEADYKVEFEVNGEWSKDPDPNEGEHRFRITTTGEEDFVKGSTITGTYTVANPSRLQRAIEDYCEIGGKSAISAGKVAFAYDGTNHYPTTWKEGDTIKIGTDSDTGNNLNNTSLEYGVDYEITSPKEVWKDADTYELTLQGKGGIKDETATIKVEVTARNINQASGTVKVDELQGFTPSKNGKPASAGNNGTANNIENTQTADGNTYSTIAAAKAALRADPKANSKQESAVRVLVEEGKHTNANLRSDVVVEIVDYGLADTVGDHGMVKLVEGVDYEVSEVKERTDEATKEKIKYVEIKGIGNYTTKLSDTVTTYKEDIDKLDDMLLNSKRITASVNPDTYTIVQKGDRIQITTGKIELWENTPGQEPKKLTMHEFDIQGYKQNGVWITTNDGIQKPGEAVVVVGPADDSHYINTIEIPFTVTSTEFKSKIAIDPIDSCTLDAAIDSLVGSKMAEHLDKEIVVRYADEPTATFPTNNYTVTVEDKETGEAIATRKYDAASGKRIWYAGDGKLTSADYVISAANETANKKPGGQVELKRGEYKVVVESTDYRYEGTAETTFKVIGEDIAANGKTFTYTKAWDYTGKAIEPEVTVITKDDIVLVKDRDYTVAYDYNVDAGTGRITVTGIGRYSGTHVETFAINQTEGTIAIEATQKAKLESGVDAGGSEAPVVEVTVNGEKVDDAKMTYSLSSSDTNVVTIAADGKTMNYVGAGTATITLTPSSANVKAAAITFTVTVNAAAVVTPEAHLTTKHYSKKTSTIGLTTNKIEEATKWQVRYATKKNMSGKHTTTVKKAKRLYHMTFNVKKSKTRYYVRVRAYVNGKWTKWSEKESIVSR